MSGISGAIASASREQLPGAREIAPRFFEPRPAEPGAGIPGLELRRLAVPDLAFLDLALRLQAIGEIGGDARVLARDLDGAAEMEFAGDGAVGLGEDEPHDAVRLRVARREPQRIARMGFAFHAFAAREEHESQIGRRP